MSLRFVEGAPKDRFVLSTREGLCAEGPVLVKIDLSGSQGKLVFDVTGSGAGVEVFQPFELVSGGGLVTQLPDVRDGDQVLSLTLAGLAAGAEVAFTIDVDDTINARQITVTDAEITGATFTLMAGDLEATAPFGGDALAVVETAECAS